jgi:hypothetical protein
MSRGSGRNDRLVLAGEPRVQLLPPIVQEREKARAARRVLVMLVVLALLVAGAGYAFGTYRTAMARTQLADAQAKTQAILAEQGQYIEGTRVATQVAQSLETQKVTTSLEILWGPLLGDIRHMLPKGAVYDSYNVVVQTPWEIALAPMGALRTPHIAEVQIVVASKDPFDQRVLEAKLEALDGFSDVTVQSLAHDKERTYLTTISLTLTEFAVSGRYLDGALDEPTKPFPTSIPEKAPDPTATDEAVDPDATTDGETP